MSHKHPQDLKGFDPADYPALREFFPGYFHEDFSDEYGSAAGAVKGFLADASGDEILQVKEEWQLLRKTFQDRAIEELQGALRRLGSAWLPENEAQLRDVDEILKSAET